MIYVIHSACDIWAYHNQNLLFIKETFKTFMRGPVKKEGNVGVEPTWMVLQTTTYPFGQSPKFMMKKTK